MEKYLSKETLDLVSRWLNDEPLPELIGIQDDCVS